MNPAAMVRKRKEAHPELYCTDRRCLWRTGGGPCLRHKPADEPECLHYNSLGESHRPDCPELAAKDPTP